MSLRGLARNAFVERSTHLAYKRIAECSSHSRHSFYCTTARIYTHVGARDFNRLIGNNYASESAGAFKSGTCARIAFALS